MNYSATPILKVRSVFKKFGAITAARDLNISVEAESITGLIGSNGAGKTTLLNMITGYLKPDSGNIIFHNQEIAGKSPKNITEHGIYRSFQIPQVFDNMSVDENLRISVSIALDKGAYKDDLGKTPEILVTETLNQFRLLDCRKQIACNLPEGTRKLLDIAMALIMKPKLLLLDEPTSGVAAEEKFLIMDMVMSAIKSEKTTVMFVEHDMEIVAKYTSRTIAFFNGEIIADGKTEKVLRDSSVKKNILGNDEQSKI